MKVVPIVEAKARLSEHVRMCRRGPVVITRNGRATAMLIPVLGDDDLEDLVLSHSARFRAIVEASRKRVGRRGEGGVSHDVFWNKMERGR